MHKKLALVVYPFFSMREISHICWLFRWYYECETIVFSSDLNPVKAEEGFLIQPHKIFDEFDIEDYECLILPGCSDCREAIRNKKLKEFLKRFKNHNDFVIGAICAGPLFLSQAGLLKGRKYTNSLYVEMNEMFEFIEAENNVYETVVEDGNIITAIGEAFCEFAVAIARKTGHNCSDDILKGVAKDYKKEDFMHYLSNADIEEFKKEFHEFINRE